MGKNTTRGTNDLFMKFIENKYFIDRLTVFYFEQIKFRQTTVIIRANLNIQILST
jgi:hypothetical protein